MKHSVEPPVELGLGRSDLQHTQIQYSETFSGSRALKSTTHTNTIVKHSVEPPVELGPGRSDLQHTQIQYRNIFCRTSCRAESTVPRSVQIYNTHKYNTVKHSEEPPVEQGAQIYNTHKYNSLKNSEEPSIELGTVCSHLHHTEANYGKPCDFLCMTSSQWRN